MRNAGPSAGENRRSFLQRCTLFGQAALARRVQWTKQRGEAGCAAEAEQGGAAFLRFAALPLTTSFFFPFDRSAGARGPGRGFRLPLPTPSGLPTHPNDQGLNPGPKSRSRGVQKPKKHCHAWPVETFRASNGGTGVFLNGFCPPLRLLSASALADAGPVGNPIPTENPRLFWRSGGLLLFFQRVPVEKIRLSEILVSPGRRPGAC